MMRKSSHDSPEQRYFHSNFSHRCRVMSFLLLQTISEQKRCNVFLRQFPDIYQENTWTNTRTSPDHTRTAIPGQYRIAVAYRRVIGATAHICEPHLDARSNLMCKTDTIGTISPRRLFLLISKQLMSSHYSMSILLESFSIGDRMATQRCCPTDSVLTWVQCTPAELRLPRLSRLIWPIFRTIVMWTSPQLWI